MVVFAFDGVVLANGYPLFVADVAIAVDPFQ